MIKNQLADILINRNEMTYSGFSGTYGKGDDGSATTRRTSSSRKYICPCCGLSVRATRTVRIKCIECDEEMIEC